MDTLIGLLIAFIVGWLIGPKLQPLLPRFWSKAHEADAALLVRFLAANGRSSTTDLKLSMEDLTRGDNDWIMRSDRSIHRLARRLEQNGTLRSTLRDGERYYELVAPREHLIDVEQV